MANNPQLSQLLSESDKRASPYPKPLKKVLQRLSDGIEFASGLFKVVYEAKIEEAEAQTRSVESQVKQL
jgi:hypothetical protein